MSEKIKCPHCGAENLAKCPEHHCAGCGNFFSRLKADLATVQKRIEEVKAAFCEAFRGKKK